MCFVVKPCRIDGHKIFPYKQTGLQISYLIQDFCEHTVLATCDSSEMFSVNVEFSEESLNLTRVGVRYNETRITIVISDTYVTLHARNLGIPISYTGGAYEYPKQIFITQTSNKIVVDIRHKVKFTVSLSDAKIHSLNEEFCGLCGKLNGTLVYSDGTTVADITDVMDIQQFTNSWRVKEVNMFLSDTPRDICSKKLNTCLLCI